MFTLLFFAFAAHGRLLFVILCEPFIAPNHIDETSSNLLRGAFLPNRVLAVVTQGEDSAAHQRLIPWLEAKIAIGGRVTAYVCERHVCKLPTGDPDTFAQQIAR